MTAASVGASQPADLAGRSEAVGEQLDGGEVHHALAGVLPKLVVSRWLRPRYTSRPSSASLGWTIVGLLSELLAAKEISVVAFFFLVGRLGIH